MQVLSGGERGRMERCFCEIGRSIRRTGFVRDGMKIEELLTIVQTVNPRSRDAARFDK